jgi:hypothetical protein
MNEFFDAAWGRLEGRLAETEQEPDPLRRYEVGIVCLKETIAELRAEIGQNQFSDKAEEVDYFRHRVPKLYSQLFLLQKLADLERCRSFVTPQKFRERLEREQAEVEQFYNRHRDVAQSSPLSRSPLDEKLFTRQEASDWSEMEVGVFIDREFTIGSYIAAMMQANKSLVSWLREELCDRVGSASAQPVVKLRWTGNLVDLVELVYGLHLSACFNDGKATLKATMQWFALHFEVKLDNHHLTFQDIARRKIAQTKFLDLVLELLKKKIDATNN